MNEASAALESSQILQVARSSNKVSDSFEEGGGLAVEGNFDMQDSRKVTMEMEISLVHEEIGGNSSSFPSSNSSNKIERQNFSRAGFVGKPPGGKHRKQYLPCPVEFAEAVDYFMEPDLVRNFTQFSLGYVNSEERPPKMNSSRSGFGGHQTMEQRENSFYASNQTLHCGFVKGPPGSPSTGFDLDDNDKAYMSKCIVVVSSCIFGSSDFLRRPASKNMSEFAKENVCFVMFVDDQTLEKISSEGNKPDGRGYVGLWKVVVVKNLPYSDMRRTGKVPKFLSHRLFPSSRYSIWVDSKLRLVVDPMHIIEHFLWRNKSEFAISKHYDHVPEGSFIIRAHTPMSNLFSCLWFNEVERFTSRDQLSFAYTYLKLRRSNPDKPFYLNMFEDCERRTLAKLFRHRVLQPPPTTGP
ncbi:unnamed protein product [Linum tenue]|uniref:TOD1/MUCI70 glycosyltransferase-like domain-containing protein n=1 Tax=Linum tenue TaxID=586396 RepID=A0AAV0J0H7_9ROSI|nr:unnamed protein product [Linum tenue]